METSTCPTCHEDVSLLRDGTLRRHKAKEKFDRETDGICSGSYSLPEKKVN